VDDGFDDGEKRGRPKTTTDDRGQDEPGEALPQLILLAEDDDAMRNVLAAQLRGNGYTVKEIPDGEALIRYLERAFRNQDAQALPDLIISDIHMPNADGLEVMEWLRERDWTIPVIVITAFGDEDVHAEAERLGVVAVLDKPFEFNQLHEFIKELA
jgi:CheY-like chemotaxis protein